MDTAHRTAPATPDIAEDAPPFPLLDGIPQQRAATTIATDAPVTAPVAGGGFMGGAGSGSVAEGGPTEAAATAPAVGNGSAGGAGSASVGVIGPAGGLGSASVAVIGLAEGLSPASVAAGGPVGGAGSDLLAVSGLAQATRPASADALTRLRALRPWRLLPTPTGTPFTFFYVAVLALISVVSAHVDPALVHSLRQGSSTDVAHLLSDPVLVLPASALWIAGGVTSPYAIMFLLVLTALERRTSAKCAAGVFLLGHVLATLATEVPVGVAVWVGHLPDSSLHRLDYGISFGVAASVGALAGLLTPWLRWPILTVYGAMLLDDLMAFTDPLTNWGHPIALAIGIATWPLLRRRRR